MACKTVALSAVSSIYYNKLQDAIASVQNWHPSMRIIVYDLGLRKCEADHLSNLHNVEVIPFPFQQYPPHVRNIHNYAWKGLAINMTLQTYEIVFWMDASVRLKAPLTDKVLQDLQAFPFRGEILYTFYDGLFTYDSTYKWFGVTRAQLGKKDQVQGGLQFLRRSSFLYKYIYNELLECLLDKSCIQPPGHRMYCPQLPQDRRPNEDTKPENVPNRSCFRYDQSALTIVIHKSFNVTVDTHFVSSLSYTLGVHRFSTICFPLYEKE
jgi:hypothetical protein